LTGWVCDERRNKDLRKSIKDIPIEKLMIETDAPYLIPRSLEIKPKNNRNEPQFLPHIANEIAALINVDPKEFNKQVFNNSKSFFGVNFKD
jgi:TatD DNase family protein